VEFHPSQYICIYNRSDSFGAAAIAADRVKGIAYVKRNND